jgi:hypothetical protein
MDLRTTYPRSVRERLAGFVHLGRMIDKCRAVHAGTQGDYVYPCPMDQRLLQFAGISSETFLRAVQGRTDQDIADWFIRTATPHEQSAIDAWNENFLRVEPDTDEKRSYFVKSRTAIDATRTDIRTWADLLDLDEKRHVPNRHETAIGESR